MRTVTFALTCFLAAALAPAATAERAPLTVSAARVSIDGTSNIHAFTASTTEVRVVRIEIAGSPEGDVLEHVLQPGGLAAFEVVVPAATLRSPKDGIDKNMHKALKVEQFPDIRFALRSIEQANGALRAAGRLTIAGVEKEVTLDLQAVRKGSALAVTGTTTLLMTDYGVTPPKAMMGMLRTNPKVQVRFELELS